MTDKQMKHTALPWAEPFYVDHPGDDGWWILNGKKGMEEHAVACVVPYNPNAEADAKFIWLACNSYYGLHKNIKDRDERYAELTLERDSLQEQNQALREALKAAQFGPDGKCPVCAGWNMSKWGETTRVHTHDCIVGLVLADQGK